VTSVLFPRTGAVVTLAALAGLLAGCTTSLQKESYPSHLKYPPRTDLVVKEKPTNEVRKLPPPGTLDESIAKATDPKVGTGAKAFNPAALDKTDAANLRVALDTVFGTPSAPRVGPEEGTVEYDVFVQWQQTVMVEQAFTNAEAIADLELDAKTLERGSKLYRRHCLHCHGLAGDGRGPTGPWVSPHPRDYRQGLFKFMSTATALTNRKPRRADLLRVLHQGIDGTSMPAFGLLPEHELQYLASYVTHLSIRGEVEYDTLVTLLDETKGKDALLKFAGKEGKDTTDVGHHVYAKTAELLVAWAKSNSEPSMAAPKYDEPTDTKAFQDSVKAGHQLFIGKAGCIACHTDFGRQPTYRYDAWGTLVRPYNLTTNTYRGGRRPIDLFWRVKGGVVPSGMPATANLTDEEYWQLVNFIKTMPYPAMLPDEVRKAVYGASELKARQEKRASAD
jgi:mono/diheme cytochrome c family protein